LILNSIAYSETIPKESDKIEPQLKQTIMNLNEQVLHSIKIKNYSLLQKVLIKSEKADVSIEAVENNFRPYSKILQTVAYTPYTDYYFPNRSVSHAISFPFSFDELKYKLFFSVIPRAQAYLSFYKANDGVVDYLISLFYVKKGENDSWKLGVFYISQMKAYGQSPLQWLDRAIELFEENSLLSASIYFYIAETMLSPAPFLKINFFDKSLSFKQRLQNQINKDLAFPMNIKYGSCQLEIFRVEPKFKQFYFYPIIKYVSCNKLNNIESVKRELFILIQDLERIFPGTTFNFDKIGFQIFTKIPLDPNKKYKYLEYIYDVFEKKIIM
jgi:hypothetical protein